MLEFVGIAAIIAVVLWAASRVMRTLNLKPHLSTTADAIALIDMYAIGKGISGERELADRVSIMTQKLKDGASSVAAGRMLYPSDAIAQIDAYDRIINNPLGLLMFIGRDKHLEAAKFILAMRRIRDELSRIAHG